MSGTSRPVPHGRHRAVASPGAGAGPRHRAASARPSLPAFEPRGVPARRPGPGLLVAESTGRGGGAPSGLRCRRAFTRGGDAGRNLQPNERATADPGRRRGERHPAGAPGHRLARSRRRGRFAPAGPPGHRLGRSRRRGRFALAGPPRFDRRSSQLTAALHPHEPLVHRVTFLRVQRPASAGVLRPSPSRGARPVRLRRARGPR